MNFIYIIKNTINAKVYVGQTWKSLQERFQHHKQNTSHVSKLKRAMNKYGAINFHIELLTITHTQEIANYYENYFINKFDSIHNGYNIREGGARGKHSESSKNKLRGRILSEETKKKMSLSHIGKTVTKQSRDKMSASRKGRIFTDEWKKKLSDAAKNKTITEETRAKLSKARIGRKFSEEWKKKISEAHKNKTWKLIDGKRVYFDILE